MAEYALKLDGVSKNFGRTKVLQELSFAVPHGVVCGFVGANGAGKTTTYSLIAGFLKYRAGTILIDGKPLRTYLSEGNLIGLLPQDMLFFEERTIFRQLYLFARLAGFSGERARQEVERVLDAVALGEKKWARPHQLSRGMRVRLGIAQALIGSPKLVLLDEPMAGLDPRMKMNIRAIIDQLRTDTTFIISSHELAELEEMCDYICIIDHGKLVDSGTKEALLHDTGKVTYAVLDAQAVSPRLKQQFPGYRIDAPDDRFVEIAFDKNQKSLAEVNRDILAWLLEQNIQVFEVRSSQSLEQAYLSATEKD